MVSVTEIAKKALGSLREQAMTQLPEQPAGTPQPTLRLVVQGNDAGLALGYPEEGDQKVEYDGATVLLIAPMVASMLDGAVVDIISTPEGDRLAIQREQPAA